LKTGKNKFVSKLLSTFVCAAMLMTQVILPAYAANEFENMFAEDLTNFSGSFKMINGDNISTPVTGNVGGFKNQSTDDPYWCGWGQDYGAYYNFTYTVNTAVAGLYDMTVVTGHNKDGGQGYLNIIVNESDKDAKQTISAVKLTPTGDISSKNTGDKAGTILLKPGKNTIKVSIADNGHDINILEDKDKNPRVAIYSFSLEGSDKLYDNLELPVNKNAVNRGRIYNGGDSSLLVGTGSEYFEYDIYSKESAEYELSVNATARTWDSADESTNRACLDASVNDNVQLTKVETMSVLSNNISDAKMQKLGVISLEPGKNTVRITNSGRYQIDRGIHINKIKLTRPDQAVIQKLDIETEDGVRMPYALTEGLKVSGTAYIKKSGTANDKMYLMTAEYNNNQLLQVKSKKVDMADFADGETKAVKVPAITLTGDGKYVKAFLLEQETFKPYCNAPCYMNADENIVFPANVLNADVTKELATTLKNNDGENYAEYGEHNDNYDIDAIFYTGHNGTKVFAYMGFPQSASETNKVPAMVLVHGGIGKAEKDWVKKWNDIGYAAIAMDLYGNGPEERTDGTTGWDNTTNKQHPYWENGLHPFLEGTVFKADYTNAGMYQNVINVVNAHTLILQDPRVDTSKTGITGISWGGVTSTTVAGIDNRFKCAAPVYGCGYLDLCCTRHVRILTKEGQTVLWDPANFAAKADMPIMFVNGDSDGFSMIASSLSYGAMKNGYLSIYHNLNHSQGTGDSLQQVYRFAQNVFNGKDPYVRITDAKIADGVLKAKYSVPSDNAIKSVSAYYMTDAEYPASDINGKWQNIENTNITYNNGEISVTLPSGTTYAYVSITDDNDDIISTKLLKAN